MDSKEEEAKDCIKNGANVNYVNQVEKWLKLFLDNGFIMLILHIYW